MADLECLAGERGGFGGERFGELARAGRADDAVDGRPREVRVAEAADRVQYRELGLRAADQPRRREQERPERQLRGARDARRVVEQLAHEQPRALGCARGPRDEEVGQAGGAGDAGERGHQLVGDRGEHGRVQALLAREVIDHRRERHAGGVGDVAHARAVEAVAREQRLGGGDDGVARAATFGRVAGHR
nr:hypothetical protein [Kofleriaceae bacterium]